MTDRLIDLPIIPFSRPRNPDQARIHLSTPGWEKITQPFAFFFLVYLGTLGYLVYTRFSPILSS